MSIKQKLKYFYFTIIKKWDNAQIRLHHLRRCGMTIGDHCIVGAGSVVTKSFPEAGSVIAGNPARKICTVEQLREKNALHALNTWGIGFQEKKAYLLENEHCFKGYRA